MIVITLYNSPCGQRVANRIQEAKVKETSATVTAFFRIIAIDTPIKESRPVMDRLMELAGEEPDAFVNILWG